MVDADQQAVSPAHGSESVKKPSSCDSMPSANGRATAVNQCHAFLVGFLLHCHLGVSHCGGGRAGCALCVNAPIMLSLLCLLSVFMRPCHELLLSGGYRVSVFVAFLSLCSDTLFMHCLTPRVCVTKVSF